MRTRRTARLSVAVFSLLVTFGSSQARAATNPLANTKWQVERYTVNDVPVELPQGGFSATGSRTLLFRTVTYQSTLHCLGDTGRYKIHERSLTIRSTVRVRPAKLCPDQFLFDFLLSNPRYRFSVDRQTLELRIDETGQRLLLSRN